MTAKASVVSAIRSNPSGYYANVHTPKNPGGAARGQLKADNERRRRLATTASPYPPAAAPVGGSDGGS